MPVFSGDVRDVIGRVLKMVVLLEQRRFVEVVVRRNAAIVSNLCQFSYVVQVVTADINVEKHRVAIRILFAD